jgi:molybdate transport system regulatory protein
MHRNVQDRPGRGAQRSAATLFIRVDLAGGLRIGPGKIALLEAIRSTGSISAAARAIGMSYRWAWLLVEEINQGAKVPAVRAAPGGRRGGRAIVTPAGESMIDLYHAIQAQARSAGDEDIQALQRVAKRLAIKPLKRSMASRR